MILRTVVIVLSGGIAGLGSAVAGMMALSMSSETAAWGWLLGAIVWAISLTAMTAIAFYRAGTADGLAAGPAAGLRRDSIWEHI